jgi:hypothetical protein
MTDAVTQGIEIHPDEIERLRKALGDAAHGAERRGYRHRRSGTVMTRRVVLRAVGGVQVAPVSGEPVAVELHDAHLAVEAEPLPVARHRVLAVVEPLLHEQSLAQPEVGLGEMSPPEPLLRVVAHRRLVGDERQERVPVARHLDEEALRERHGVLQRQALAVPGAALPRLVRLERDERPEPAQVAQVPAREPLRERRFHGGI